MPSATVVVVNNTTKAYVADGALVQVKKDIAVQAHGSEDILTVAPAVLRHRIILNFDAHADGETTETILTKIFEAVSPRV